MTDVLTPEQRSRCMAAIRSRDTKPEILVRSMVHRMGFRFCLHRKDLLGKPDIVLPSRHKIIFVHGCFWHQHPKCRFATRPATRTEFWAEKLDGNRNRDRRVTGELRNQGWQILTVWECQTRHPEQLAEQLHRFLQD